MVGFLDILRIHVWTINTINRRLIGPIFYTVLIEILCIVFLKNGGIFSLFSVDKSFGPANHRLTI